MYLSMPLVLKYLIVIIFIFGSFSSMAQNNAILLIGDGMGPTVVSATRMHFEGVDGKLFLDKAPYRGTVTTHSKDSIVTDSAAAATAMATGQKTNNGFLSLAPPRKKMLNKTTRGTPLKTILEMAAEKGLSVGLVTTVEISHATPAAFYAHVPSRRDTPRIMQELKNSPVDLILGGGLGDYKKDLESKFHIVTNMKDLRCHPNKPILGSLFGQRFPYIGDVKNKSLRKKALLKLVKFSIDCLSKNKKGYFLMIEAGRIDQALHQRNICNALYETKEFDEVTRYVVKRVNKKNTLVLATADHDTGGLAINGDLLRKDKFFTKKPCWKGQVTKTAKLSHLQHTFQTLRLSTDDLYPEFTFSHPQKRNFIKSTHTAHDVQLLGWGLGAQQVQGFHDNTFVFTLLKEGLGL